MRSLRCSSALFGKRGKFPVPNVEAARWVAFSLSLGSNPVLLIKGPQLDQVAPIALPEDVTPVVNKQV